MEIGELAKRAKECLAGKSRSYVEDAKLFASEVLVYLQYQLGASFQEHAGTCVRCRVSAIEGMQGPCEVGQKLLEAREEIVK